MKLFSVKGNLVSRVCSSPCAGQEEQAEHEPLIPLTADEIVVRLSELLSKGDAPEFTREWAEMWMKAFCEARETAPKKEKWQRRRSSISRRSTTHKRISKKSAGSDRRVRAVVAGHREISVR